MKYKKIKKIEDEKNDGAKRRYNRLISVLNIESNEEKNEEKENKEKNEFRRFSNLDFFEKKLTGKFEGLEEDENFNNKKISSDNSNVKRPTLEENENGEISIIICIYILIYLRLPSFF